MCIRCLKQRASMALRTDNGEVDMKKRQGFTLIELLVVLAIVALLLTIVAPKYFNSVDKASEAVLKQNLHGLRDTLDKFYTDQNRYPTSLQELVAKKYIRTVPQDPITHSATSWRLIMAPEEKGGGIMDIQSGSTDKAADGSNYASW